MAFKQVYDCLPPELRKRVESASLVEVDYASVERRILAGLTDEEKQRMQDAYTTEEGTKDNGTD